MRARFLLLCTTLLPAPAAAQTATHIGPRVKPFVREDATTIVLTHVRVIDGTGAAAHTDQSIVLGDGKILAVGDAASTKVPDGAKVLDLAGRTVIPGLVGMHDHMYYPAPLGPPAMYPEHATSFPRLYLAGGVTTIRTTGSIEPYTDLEPIRSSSRDASPTHVRKAAIR